MSIYKDFVIFSTGLAAGIYISKLDENVKIKQKFDDILYKIKPVLRKIKDEIFNFMENLNLKNSFENIKINIEEFIRILNQKLKTFFEISDTSEKLKFLKEEILNILNSFQTTIKHQKNNFTTHEENLILIDNDFNDKN